MKKKWLSANCGHFNILLLKNFQYVHFSNYLIYLQLFNITLILSKNI